MSDTLIEVAPVKDASATIMRALTPMTSSIWSVWFLPINSTFRYAESYLQFGDEVGMALLFHRMGLGWHSKDQCHIIRLCLIDAALVLMLSGSRLTSSIPSFKERVHTPISFVKENSFPLFFSAMESLSPQIFSFMERHNQTTSSFMERLISPKSSFLERYVVNFVSMTKALAAKAVFDHELDLGLLSLSSILNPSR